MISKALEEYLKNMYILKKQNGNIRVTDVASKMNCTKPSVNKALYNLRDEGMVNYESYGVIDVLNLSEEESKEEAEKMKLAITDNTVNHLAKYVHKVLDLSNLDCNYDINKEQCRSCLRRKPKVNA